MTPTDLVIDDLEERIYIWQLIKNIESIGQKLLMPDTLNVFTNLKGVTMIVYRFWTKTKYGKVLKIYEGWFLFGALPLYLKILQKD